MTDQSTHDRVATLLRESREAEAGAGMAHDACDDRAEEKLMEKARRLMREAEKIDPRHEGPAWSTEAQ